MGIERRLDEAHDVEGFPVFGGEVFLLAEADAVLARRRAVGGDRQRYDLAVEALDDTGTQTSVGQPFAPGFSATVA